MPDKIALTYRIKRTKLNARLALRQRADLFNDQFISANKISLPQGHFLILILYTGGRGGGGKNSQ